MARHLYSFLTGYYLGLFSTLVDHQRTLFTAQHFLFFYFYRPLYDLFSSPILVTPNDYTTDLR